MKSRGRKQLEKIDGNTLSKKELDKNCKKTKLVISVNCF